MVLDSLIRNSLNERRITDTTSVERMLKGNLDVAEAAGLGRSGLRSEGDVSRLAASSSPSAVAIRGTAGNAVASNIVSYLQFMKNAGDKKMAQVLTDPSMGKLIDAQNYSKAKILADLARQAALTNNTGE